MHDYKNSFYGGCQDFVNYIWLIDNCNAISDRCGYKTKCDKKKRRAESTYKALISPLCR